MTRTPWALWNLRSGEPSEGASTLEAIDVLEKSMQRVEEAERQSRRMAGMLHMYIHVMEMSAEPEKRAARLRCAAHAGAGLRVTCATCRHTSTCAAVTTTRR